MYNLELNGSYYEIGRQLGKHLSKVKSYPPKFSKETLEKTLPYEEMAKKYTPDLLEEFRGLSDELDIDYYVPLTLELTPFRFQTLCLVYAVSGEHTKNGLPVLARSHEWKEEESENLAVCRTAPKGKLKSLGFTFHWPLVSRYGGINEAGLAISGASATFENSGPGIILNIAMRWILDNCKTTHDAVEFFKKIPKVWGESYVIVDKNNTIAKVQTHASQTIVEYSKRGFESATIQYDSLKLQSIVNDSWEGADEVHSDRQMFMSNWFEKNKGNIDTTMVIESLKNHENRMCCHDIDGLEICWSYVLQPTSEEAYLCAGRPCKGEYKKLDVTF